MSFASHSVPPTIPEERADFSLGPQSFCGRCDKPSTLLCSRCRNAFYCSTNCSNDNWIYHQYLCQSYQGLGIADEPGQHPEENRALQGNSYWAIYIPTGPEVGDPDFFSLPYSATGQNERPHLGILQRLLRSQSIGFHTIFASARHKHYYDANCINEGKLVEIAYNETARRDGSKPNQFVQSIVAEQDREMWYGAYIAFGIRRDIQPLILDILPNAYSIEDGPVRGFDLDTMDLGPIMERFRDKLFWSIKMEFDLEGMMRRITNRT